MLSRLLTVGLLVLIVAPLAVAPGSGPASFASAKVALQITGGEPSLILDPRTTPATQYVTAPFQGVWRSTDGGVSWTQRSPDSFSGGPITNGDASLAVDADGVLYLSGLTDDGQLASRVPVQVSTDGGATWIRFFYLHDSATGIDCDRQWTAARGHGEAVTTVRCGSEMWLWRTTNAGLSWTGPITVQNVDDVFTGGPITYSPDGNLYFLYFNGNSELRLARSADGGLTWTSRLVSSDGQSVSFPVVAADNLGNLYAAWETSDILLLPPLNSVVKVATSIDDGTTWSAPRQVSSSETAAIFPWIVALAPGKVDVAFYIEQNITSADLGGPITTWDVVVAQSTNALALVPSYSRVTAVNDFHKGSICTTGLACVGPQNLLGVGNVPTPFDRRLLDFFEMRADGAGNAYMVYPHDRPATSGIIGDAVFSWVDFEVARQTGGTQIS